MKPSNSVIDFSTWFWADGRIRRGDPEERHVKHPEVNLRCLAEIFKTKRQPLTRHLSDVPTLGCRLRLNTQFHNLYLFESKLREVSPQLKEFSSELRVSELLLCLKPQLNRLRIIQDLPPAVVEMTGPLRTSD